MRHRCLLFLFFTLVLYQLGGFIYIHCIHNKGECKHQKNSDENPPVNELSKDEDNDFTLSRFKKLTAEEERAERLKNFYDSCKGSTAKKSVNELTKVEADLLFRHILVSHKYKFLYCYTPKVACSNWKRIVKYLNGEISKIDPHKMDHLHGLYKLSDYTKQEREEMLKNYYKFMFVRNPLERLLSAYRNKFGEIEDTMRSYGMKIIKQYRNVTVQKETHVGKIPGDDISFEEFLRYTIDAGDPATMNEHWAPMATLCQPCIVKYDCVGSYDHIEEDSEAILRHIGAPESLHFPQRQSWYSPTNNAMTAYFYSLIHNTYWRQLYRRYFYDFSLFSYDLPRQLL